MEFSCGRTGAIYSIAQKQNYILSLNKSYLNIVTILVLKMHVFSQKKKKLEYFTHFSLIFSPEGN